MLSVRTKTLRPCKGYLSSKYPRPAASQTRGLLAAGALVPSFLRNASTLNGLAAALIGRDLISATAPVTCGAAILVPVAFLYAWLGTLLLFVDNMSVPGAAKSTTEPKLEYDRKKSSELLTLLG